MIEIRGIEKSFGRLQVLRDVHLKLQPGKVTAIAGPNASGKTTLIKILLGLVRADAGSVSINGTSLNGDCSYRRQVGYMPQYAQFPENLTGGDVLAMVRDLRGGVGQADEELVAALELEDQLEKPLRTLSGGTRQKVSAVLAFLFKPSLLVLDEPTAGLDPVSSGRLKDKIRRERDRGRLVLLTTHILSEIEELADHLVFLLEGRIYFDGSLAELRERTGESQLERAVARLMEEAQS